MGGKTLIAFVSCFVVLLVRIYSDHEYYINQRIPIHATFKNVSPYIVQLDYIPTASFSPSKMTELTPSASVVVNTFVSHQFKAHSGHHNQYFTISANRHLYEIDFKNNGERPATPMLSTTLLTEGILTAFAPLQQILSLSLQAILLLSAIVLFFKFGNNSAKDDQFIISPISSKALTTHHMLKFLAVVVMISDHFGKVFFAGNQWLEIPAQSGCALFFYFLIGTNSKKWNTSAFKILICFFFLHYLVEVQNLNAFTLLTIAFVRMILPLVPLEKYGWISNACFVCGLLIIDPLFDNVLGWAYGARSLLIAGAGYLLTSNPVIDANTLPGSIKKGFLWLVIGTILHLYQTYQNLLFPLSDHLLQTLTLVSFWAGACYLMATYRYEQITMGVFNRFIRFVSAYSLEIYVIHFLIIKVLVMQYF